jgi:hypothetical protein
VDVDALLRRIRSTAIVVCVVLTAAALVLARGRAWPAVAVLAGGLLAAISYQLIVSGAGALVDGLTRASTNDDDAAAPVAARPALALTVAKLTGRYALLALLAYVMIARLRLHPLGLLAGASSVVAAVSIEAVRFLLKKTP